MSTGIYCRGKIWLPLSGPTVFVAGGAARVPGPRPEIRSFRFLPRKPRSSLQFCDRRSRALANFTRSLSRHDRITFAWSVDSSAFSRRRVWRFHAVFLFQRGRRRKAARGGEERPL